MQMSTLKRGEVEPLIRPVKHKSHDDRVEVLFADKSPFQSAIKT